MLDYIEFSAKIKEKYPEYKDVDDLTLAQKMVEKYPEYKEKISFEGVKEEKKQPENEEKKGIDLTPSGLAKNTLASVLAPIRSGIYGEDYKTARENALGNVEKFKPAKGAGDFLVDMAVYSKLPMLKGAGVGNFLGNAAIQGGVPAALESLKRGGNAVEGAGFGTGIASLLQTIPYVGKGLGKVGSKAVELSGRVGQIKPETLKQVTKPESMALEMTPDDASNALLDITKQIRENFDMLRKSKGAAVDEAVRNLGENAPRFDIKDLFNDIKGTFDNYQLDKANPARTLAGGLENDLNNIVNSVTENPAEIYKPVQDKISPYFSKEKEAEAFKILSAATGKPINWLKSQLNAQTFANGVGKRKEFIENLVGNTEDKLANLGNEYFEGMKFYKPKDLDDITAGAEIAEQALDDVLNKRFNVYEAEPLTRAMNEAENGFNNLLSKIAQNPRVEESYSTAFPELEKIIKDLPEEVKDDYIGRMGTALEDIYNKANTVSPLSLQGIKKIVGQMGKWGDETSRGYVEPVIEQVYGKFANRLNELSPEISAANKAFSDLMQYKKNDTVAQILKGDLLSEGKLGGAPSALKAYKSSINKGSGQANLKSLENLLEKEAGQKPFLNKIDDINAAMDLLKTENTGLGGAASIAKALFTRPILTAVRGANRMELPQKIQNIKDVLSPIGRLMPALGAKGVANMLYGGVSYDDYR